MQISDVFGKWLRDYRQSHGLTLEQISDAARKYSGGWKASKFSQIERGGSKADALPTMLICLSALNDLRETRGEVPDLSLKDALSSCDTFKISKFFTASATSVLGTLSAEPVRLNMAPIEHSPSMWELPKVRDKARYEYDGDSEDGIRVLLMESTHAPTSAETHMAEKLLWEPIKIAAICDVLYGHSLDEESAMRAGHGATPQKRGRITRLLKTEIEQYAKKVEEEERSAYGHAGGLLQD